VQNGLVTQWDGFNNAGIGLHDAYATAWKDLKGNLDLTLNANGFWGDKALEVRGYAGVAAAAAGAYRTIEVVCRLYSGMDSLVFTPGIGDTGGNGYNRTVYFTNNGKTCRVSNAWGTSVKQISYAKFDPEVDLQLAALYDQKDTPFDTYTNGIKTVSSLENKGMRGGGNGKAAVGGWSKGDGSGGGTAPTFGRIYAIRLYDKLLTDGELAYNAAVDAVRFGGKSPAEAFTGDLRWNASTSSVEARITASLVAGGGTFKVNGEDSAEAWVALGETATVTYVPAEGEVPLSWSGLPFDATVADDSLSATFAVRGASAPRLQLKTVFSDEGSLIADGGFEDGAGYVFDGGHKNGWTYRWARSGTNFQLAYSDSSTPDHGFSYVKNYQKIHAQQTGVVIPAGDYVLAFDYAYAPNTPFDVYFRVVDSGGTTRTLASVATDVQRDGTSWHAVEVPVHFDVDDVYTFRVGSEGSGNNYIYFDNVRLVSQTDLRIDAIPNQPYLGEQVRPPVVVRDAAGRVLQEGDDYDLRWGANNSAGNGYVAAVGKNGHYGVAGANFIIGKPIYVTPEGVSTADGASWATSVDFATALAKATAGTAPWEIWVAGANVMAAAATVRTFNANVQLRGGFAGTEDSLDERADGALSVLDGAGAYDVMNWKSFANVQIERFRFMNCPGRVLQRTTNYQGGLALEDCVFERNATAGSKAAIYFICQAAKEKLILRNCKFLGNAADGAITYAHGAAVYLLAGAIDASGCEFTDYLGTGTDSSIVRLDGPGTGTVFDHCLFRGNAAIGSCVYVNRSSDQHTTDFGHCTFAHNAGCSSAKGTGIHAVKGVVKVRNSIFFGNSNGEPSSGADITCGVNSPCDIDFTLFAADDSEHIVLGNGRSSKGAGVRTGDPLFVSETDVHLLSEAGYYDAAGGIHYAAQGVRSLAIDAGDPESDYSLEITPNGGCANLGYYGNTRQASHTPAAEPAVDGIPQVMWNDPDGYSMPTVSFTMGGTGAYTAQGVIYISTDGGATWENVSGTLGGLVNGATRAFTVPGYYEPGETIQVKVAVSGAGHDSVSEAAEATVQGTLPPWYGKKGPDNVIHVRPGAKGKQDGSSWTDAFALWADALAVISEQKNEIWVVGANMIFDAATRTFDCPVTIRGGFTGVERAASERPAGLRSVMDGQDMYAGFVFTSSKGVILEGLEFANCRTYGLCKTGGAGDLTVSNCAFRACGDMGASFTGTSAATLRLVDCLVDRCQHKTSGANVGKVAQGVMISTFKRAYVDGCTFTHNGRSGYRVRPLGSMLYATGAPLTMRNSRFAGNWNEANQDNPQAACKVISTSGACAITNCVFTGWYANNAESDKPPALYVSLASADATFDVVNCTFAYNVLSYKGSSAAIGLNKGTMNVLNSIFFGNLTPADSTYPSDIWVASGATAHVRYCLFSEDSANCYKADADGTLDVVRKTCTYGDPLFVTSADDFKSIFNCTELVKGSFKWPGVDAAAELNVHLRGGSGYVDETTGETVKDWARKRYGNSPAIDAGDPAGDWANEPTPNGRRVNLGAYGNTPWATMAKPGTLIFVK